jgi:hypothetical protein
MSTGLIESPQSTALSTAAAGVQARQIAEVQAAMISAKKFPRDEGQAIAKILKTCERQGFAENAEYSYPRGDKTVTGPSIKMAEEMQRAWGNIQSGVMELERLDDKSLCQAYAVDLETNTRAEIAFTVEHYIDTRNGKRRVTDSRDINGLILNYGNRIKRNCILSLIPDDIVDMALQQCQETLKRSAGVKKLEDRIAAMLSKFSEIGVSSQMIAVRLKHNTQSISERELTQLGKIYNSIKQEAGTIEQYFPQPVPNAEADKTPKQDVIEPDMQQS